MNLISDHLKSLVEQAIAAAQSAGALPDFTAPDVEVTRPRDSSHGDYATNVAMQSARLARLAPLKIAEIIVNHLPDADYLGEASVAPPGFVNFQLAERWLVQQVDQVRKEGVQFGRMELGHGKSANIEFVSANPTGPLHVGRTWGAVLGDTIANLLENVGYHVTREYYFNNAGRQMRLLGESVRARYLELLGHQVDFPAEGYQGDYIGEIAQKILAAQGAGWVEEGWEPFKTTAENWVFENIRDTLARLGVYFDVWFNENSLYESSVVQKTVEALRARGYAYDADGAVWFRAQEFGAEKDRVLVKSSGEPTYRLPDIAYHVNKLERGFDLLVNIFGADHLAEYPDVIAGVQALGYDAERIQVVIHQFINLMREGRQVRMSTRRADYVTLDDLLDEVTYLPGPVYPESYSAGRQQATDTSSETGVPIPGKDPVRFMLLTRSPDSTINFDLDLVKQQSNENPVYYVQYAHARICSILRVAEERGFPEVVYTTGDVSPLGHPAELGLIRKLLELTEVISLSVSRLQPHHLTRYAQELATQFHAFYHECRVVDPENEQLTKARLKLVDASRIVLARTLGLMGMTAPERM